MTMNFSQPQAIGSFLRPADLAGHLILVTDVHEAFDRYDDLAGKDKLNVRFDYVDLDDPRATLVTDAISSHPGIALRLKANVGKAGSPILGRIGQEPSKKAGFNPTWVLGEYAPGIDDVKASAWMTDRVAASLAQPTPAAQTGFASTTAPPAFAAPAAAVPAQALTPELIASMLQAGIAIPDGY